MNNSRPRVLIVYPYPSIDTNPTMALLLETLAARKVEVHVLVAKGEDFLLPESFGETVRLEFVPSSVFFDIRSLSLRGLPVRVARKYLRSKQYRDSFDHFDYVAFGLLKGKRYSVIVGVDPHGIVLADRVNRWAKRPLVYVSFEIMFGEEVVVSAEQKLKSLELAACSRASVALTQDAERGEEFCRETAIQAGKVVMAPVAPPPEEVSRSDYLRKMLGIPSNKRIVLYCGNLETWASRDEWAEMVSYWPDKYCLVVHSRSKVHRRVERFVKDLTDTGKVFFSAEPVTRTNMSRLVASADFGLAPYKPVPDNWWTGKNIYHLGLSSGKVAYYAMCGLPILARSLPVFEREFSRFNCGKVYKRLIDTGRLLEEMDDKYVCYSNGARRLYRERLNPLDPMRQFCDRLVQLFEME